MNNRTFRLFVSSTFNDFLQEREILNNEIHPVIDDFCKSKGYNFQIVDLRWGVTTESALNQKTVSICLNEVRRCRKLSPKPNFLLMIGERYGWIPLPPSISKVDFEKIASKLSDDDREIIEEWYILDENKIGGEYFLKPRTDIYTDDEFWFAKEAQLRSILTKTVEKHFEDLKENFTTSATEQEIVEGMFCEKDISQNTIAIFRSGFSNPDKDREKLEQLKRKILKKLAEDNCQDKFISLKYDDNYVEFFKKTVIEILKKSVTEEIERIKKERKEQKCSADFYGGFIEKKRSLFVGRENELKKIEQFVVSDNSDGILWITGQSGSGKSSLIAEYITRCKQECYCVFFGADERSYTLTGSLSRMCEEIRGWKYRVNKRNITEIFFDTIFSVPDDKKIVIIIDGLESFYDISDIHENIFPSTIPSNVKIIVSSANNELPERFSGKKREKICIDSLSPTEGKNLFYAMLKRKDRCISNECQRTEIEKIIDKGCLPLQLWLMAEYCSSWHSGDIAEQLADNPEGIVDLYIDSMFKKFGHNKELIYFALSLITVSPFGICENEIQKLLMSFESIRNYFLSESRYSHSLEDLPIVIWSRIFYDFDGCLSLVNNHGHYTIKFSHQIFYKVISEKLADYCNKAADTLISFFLSMDNYNDTQKRSPNTRKIISLVPLLKTQSRFEQISELLQDVTFIDASVKANNFSVLFDTLEHCILCEETLKRKETLKKIYKCLQRNSEPLSCYRNGFLSCAYADGLIAENKSILRYKKNTAQDGDILFFPYPSDSSVVWSENSAKYAVCMPNHVCICLTKTQEELCRIFLKEYDKEDAVIVKELIWLNESLIAFSCDKCLMIYDVSQNVPKISDILVYKDDVSVLQHIKELNLLLYQVNNLVYSYNLIQKKLVYTFKRRKEALSTTKKRFIYNSQENMLMLSDYNWRILCYDAENWKMVKKIRIPYKRKTYFNWIGMNDIWQMKDKKILLSESNYDIGRFETIDLKNNKTISFYPPNVKKINSYIVGEKYVVIAYENILMCIDVTDFSFPFSCYKSEGITKIFWKEKDKTVAMLCSQGFLVVELESFSISENLKNCYSGNTPILMSFKNSKKLWSYIKSIFWFLQRNPNSQYIYDNFFIYQKPDFTSDYIRSASLTAEANDGKLAVAYEMNDAINIFDEKGDVLCVFDRLNLAVNNSILKMDFSPDSKYIMIWRTRNFTVVNLESLKMVLNVPLTNRPALNSEFAPDSGSVSVTLCDESTYVYSFAGKKWDKKLPYKLHKNAKRSPYFSVYKWNPHNEKAKIRSLILQEEFSMFENIQNWINDIRIYVGENHYIYGKNGYFYLDGKGKQRFNNGNNNFYESLQYEQQKDATPLDCFIREKNDFTSEILEAGKYIILVLKRISSVIIFDTDKMIVADAYKHHSEIIGVKFNDSKSITLYSNKAPYKTELEINLPENQD